MRWSIVLGLALFTAQAHAAKTPVRIYIDNSQCSAYFDIYTNHIAAIARGVCTDAYPYSGTIGKIKGLGSALTLVAGYNPDGRVRFLIFQYPLVTGGWWQSYIGAKSWTKIRNNGSGTYTVGGSAASTKPH